MQHFCFWMCWVIRVQIIKLVFHSTNAFLVCFFNVQVFFFILEQKGYQKTVLWNSHYYGKCSWCWEGADVLGQGLRSSSGEPGAWLKPAELSGECSAACFLWRQEVFALSHLLAALSYSCNPLSCTNITVVFAINSLLCAKKKVHFPDRGWEFWCSVRCRNPRKEETVSSLLLKPLPRWWGLPAVTHQSRLSNPAGSCSLPPRPSHAF